MAVRVKWFVPADREHPFRPFGIDSAGPAMLFAHGSGATRPISNSDGSSQRANPTRRHDHRLWPSPDRPATGSGHGPSSAGRGARP
ncbi:hypothetical protein Jiend_49980 [Micromonospora endophytica]|nr:hypothetical protein Jiend_49980 [Micromonospora endophytica]